MIFETNRDLMRNKKVQSCARTVPPYFPCFNVELMFWCFACVLFLESRNVPAPRTKAHYATLYRPRLWQSAHVRNILEQWSKTACFQSFMRRHGNTRVELDELDDQAFGGSTVVQQKAPTCQRSAHDLEIFLNFSSKQLPVVFNRLCDVTVIQE